MKKREPLTFDLTPLIDVVFILIIFFIVTSSFRKDKTALNLTLPSSNATQIKIDKKQLIIEVTKSKFAYMGDETTLLNIQKHLEKIKDYKQSIVIKIDKDVPYKRVVSILDILQLNNLNNISLVTTKNH